MQVGKKTPWKEAVQNLTMAGTRGIVQPREEVSMGGFSSVKRMAPVVQDVDGVGGKGRNHKDAG